LLHQPTRDARPTAKAAQSHHRHTLVGQIKGHAGSVEACHGHCWQSRPSTITMPPINHSGNPHSALDEILGSNSLNIVGRFLRRAPGVKAHAPTEFLSLFFGFSP